MVRPVLVCILFVVGAALALNSNSQQQELPKPFKGSQSYVYRFDTQVATSLIGASASEIQQSAATRLRADVQLAFTNDRHAKLRLQNVRIGDLNGELPKTQRVQPLEHFEKKQLPEQVRQKLEMPLSVSLVDGVVERINFHEDDSAWSKNIKRAVLNMIQLNLKRNDVQGLKMQSSMPMIDEQQSSSRDLPMFSIPEITLEGECEAVYSVQKNQKYGSEDDERAPFNVTKTLNFNKCQRTADISFGYQANPAEQLRCLNCIRKQRPQPDAQQSEQVRFSHCQMECQPNKVNEDKDVERSTFVRYELVGKPEKFALKKVHMLSQIVVKAQNPASQNTVIQVVSLSELTFKEQETGDKLVPSFKQSTTDETLMYSPEWDIKVKRFYMFGDEEYTERDTPFHGTQKKEQKAAHVITKILRQWNDKEQGYELDTAIRFNTLVEVIRQCTVKEIKAIEQAIKSIPQEQEQQSPQHNQQQAISIFQDALAVAATRNSLFVLADKIIKQEIQTVKAVKILQIFTANQHSPSERQADILERIAKSEVAQKSSPLKQTAWLSFGQAVGAICQDKPAQGQKEIFRTEEICPKGKKEQYKRTLMEQWNTKTDSIYEQILAIKTLGNAALDNTIPELQKIIKEKGQPTLVRMEAIDALRRLRTSMPQKIRQILLPIVQNQREEPEVRMAAVSMIFYTHPDKSILDQVIFATINDRSQNYKSFVMSALEALSKSPSSAEQEIANHMKAALKMIKLEPEQMRPSRKYRVPIYVSEQENTEEQNIFLGLASIVSPANMLPIHLATSIRTAFNGEATEENLQLSVSQKNLEQWYEKLHEYIQQQYNRGDSENEQERESSERKYAKDLRSVYSSLGIKSRRHGSYYLSNEDEDSYEDQQQQGQGSQSKRTGGDQPFGMIVLRTNDVDQALIPISDQQLPQIVRKMMQGEKPSLLSELNSEISERLSTGQHFRNHMGMTMNEKRSKVPTTSGLPVELSRKTSAVVSVEGELKVRFESEKLESSRGLTAELKMRTSGIASHLHKADVWSPVVASGVESVRTVEVNTPIDIKLRVDSQKAELKIRLPQEKRLRLLALHTLPVTFTRQFDMQSRTFREARVRSVQNWGLEHSLREHQASEQQSNVFQVDGHFHQLKDPKQIVQALYTTENNVHIYYNPTEKAPKELTLRVSGSAFQKHESHGKPEMDSFYSSSKSFHQPIYENDYEGMQLDEDSQRRQKLSSYSQKYSAGSQAYKHELKLEAEARCGEKTHRATMEVKAGCDSGLKHCKVFVDAERTPLYSESQPWTMTTKIQTVAPEILSNGEDQQQQQGEDQESQSTSSKHLRMLVKVDSEWGTDRRSQMNLRLQAEPTKTSGWKRAFLNKIDMICEYQLNKEPKQLAHRAYELAKATYFWQLATEEKRSDQNVVRATIVIDPITRRYANISVQTPLERLRVESIELPFRMSPYSLNRRPTNIRSFGHLIQGVTSYGGAQCVANQRRIETFDGVAYKAPMSNGCWHVLAKDCSRDEPRFVVLMKKSQQEDEKTLVRIMTPQGTIELSSKPTSQGTPVVKVNGQKVEQEDELSQQGIETSYGKVYVNKNGVKVEFDGEDAKVKVSGQYKNLACGLCGHYDDEQENTFRTSDNQMSNNLKQFHKSYTLKNEECSDSQLNKFYEQQDSSEFSIRPHGGRRSQRKQQQNSWFFDQSEEESDERQQQRQGDEYENEDSSEEWTSGQNKQQQNGEQRMSGGKRSPVQRTKVIEYEHKVCFSQEPVKKCPKGTMPDEDAETKEVKVPFFCKDRSTIEARRMLRQVRNGQTIDTAQEQSRSFVETIEIPTRCVPAY